MANRAIEAKSGLKPKFLTKTDPKNEATPEIIRRIEIQYPHSLNCLSLSRCDEKRTLKAGVPKASPKARIR